MLMLLELLPSLSLGIEVGRVYGFMYISKELISEFNAGFRSMFSVADFDGIHNKLVCGNIIH